MLAGVLWAAGYAIWARTYEDSISWFTFDRDGALAHTVEVAIAARLQRDLWMMAWPPLAVPTIILLVPLAGGPLLRWTRRGFDSDFDIDGGR
ncbi:MAG: hypothetical protein EON59_07365 [Alphaproteobacteria bacterium]|nr:MAG: hypothetical protein EON59_07365 [Alphaproteobacteria bacterium]